MPLYALLPSDGVFAIHPALILTVFVPSALALVEDIHISHLY